MSQAMETADVIVIGGGVAGLSTAMQVGSRGQKVIVLERQSLGCGSTGRAADTRRSDGLLAAVDRLR